MLLTIPTKKIKISWLGRDSSMFWSTLFMQEAWQNLDSTSMGQNKEKETRKIIHQNKVFYVQYTIGIF